MKIPPARITNHWEKNKKTKNKNTEKKKEKFFAVRDKTQSHIQLMMMAARGIIVTSSVRRAVLSAVAATTARSSWPVVGISASPFRGLASHSSDHHDDHHDHHHYPSPFEAPAGRPAPLKEEWVKLANEWPAEAHASSTIEYESRAEFHHVPGVGHYLSRALLLAALAYGAYELNAFVTADAEVHPFTRLVASLARTPEENSAASEEQFKMQRRRADDRMIILRAPNAYEKMYRLPFPEVYERASDFLIEPGTQISFEGVKPKYSWQENDDLYGPPYPKQ
ncbi:hypothetical protein DFJ73DRAFT_68805 [Zopfochytrium polystomum]|nr:hypothetical protein DFJ73DRAFT_68805 [Zopfochytrium polystomum]